MKRLNGKYATPIGNVWSVTNILNIINKPQLMPWAANNQFEADKDRAWEIRDMQFEDRPHFDLEMEPAKGKYKEVSQKAMDLGSLVHGMIDAYFQVWGFTKENFYEDTYNEEYYMLFLSDYYPTKAIQCLAGFFRAIRENNITIHQSEQTVYHSEGFAGTLDAIGTFDDAEGVFDWKTGGVYWPYWLQLEAYKRAWEQMYKKGLSFRGIIRLDTDNPGEYEILIRPLTINTELRIWVDKRKKKKEYERKVRKITSDHEVDWQAFLSAKKLFERSKE